MINAVLNLVVGALDHGAVAPIGAVLTLVSVLGHLVSLLHQCPYLSGALAYVVIHLVELLLNSASIAFLNG